MMRKKKPIRRDPNIVSLSREHHFGLLFCWKIRQGIIKEIAPDRLVKYVAYFWTHNLHRHFEKEESILFSLLPDDALVKRAISEHAAIAKKIGLCTTVPTTYPALLALAEQVTDHIRFEERKLFPYLEKKLTAADLEKSGALLKQNWPEPLTDEFDDEFWNNKS